jgi:hypothetical protein
MKSHKWTNEKAQVPVTTAAVFLLLPEKQGYLKYGDYTLLSNSVYSSVAIV